MHRLNTLLSQNPVFSSLDPSERNNLAQLALPRSFQKGERVAHYGDVWPYLFLVDKGTLTAVKESEEGRSLIIVTLHPGEIFWGAAFFQEAAPMLAALVANQDSRIYLWQRERVLPLLLRNGSVSWELASLLVKRMQRASDIVEELAFQPVAGRLAKLLVSRFADTGTERVSRNLTLDDMAAHIGTTREMVCRILHRFSSQGLIEITRTEFVFTDRQALSQLAQIAPE